MLARQAAHAFAFIAHYPSHAVRQVAVVKVGVAAHVCADNPNAVFFQFTQSTGKIGYGNIRHSFRRATGNFADGRIQAGAFVFGRNHGMYAHRIGSTQARAEVVRIGNAVQYQQKRWFAQVFQYIFQMNMVFGSIDKPDHALMARTFADGIQAVGIGEMHTYVFRGCFIQYIAGARIGFALLDIEFGNRFRVLPQTGIDSVKAIDESLVCHVFALSKNSDGHYNK